MKTLLIAFVALWSCIEPITEFPKEARDQKMITLDGQETSFGAFIDQYKGKTVVIDIWASWCKDCITGMPGVKALQHNEASKDVVFLFISMDKNQDSWKKGIKSLGIEGEHLFMGKDWKTPFNLAIDLDWIPRYMVVGKNGKIILHRAIKADDETIVEAIKADK